MATVEYDPIPVVDPTTKAPRTDLWGAKLTVVFHDTNIPVPNLLEAGSHAPLANPFTVSAIGFTPSIAIENGPVRVDYVSANGEFRTPVTSFSGAQANMDEAVASAAASAAAAQAAIELADVVDLVPGANITLTPTAEGVVIASTGTGTGDAGGFTGTVTASQISDATATGVNVIKATDATAARNAIGAGTSNVKIGTAAGDAVGAGTAVLLTGNQTKAGVLTFTSAPVVPDASFTVAKIAGFQGAVTAAVGASAAVKNQVASTRMYDATTGTWPPRATGYPYDIAVAPSKDIPAPADAVIGDRLEYVAD